MKILDQNEIDKIAAKLYIKDPKEQEKFVNDEQYKLLRSAIMLYLKPNKHQLLTLEERTNFGIVYDNDYSFTDFDFSHRDMALKKFRLLPESYGDWYLFEKVAYNFHYKFLKDVYYSKLENGLLYNNYDKFHELCFSNTHIFNYALYPFKSDIRFIKDFQGYWCELYFDDDEYAFLNPLFRHVSKGKEYLTIFYLNLSKTPQKWEPTEEEEANLEYEEVAFTVPGTLIYYKHLFKKFFLKNKILNLPPEKLNDFYFDIYMGYMMIQAHQYDSHEIMFHSEKFCCQYLLTSSPYNVFKDALIFYYSLYWLDYFSHQFRWIGRPFHNKSHLCHVLALDKTMYYVGITVNYSANFSDEYTQSNILTDYKDPAVQAELEENNILIHYTIWVDGVGGPEVFEDFRSDLLEVGPCDGYDRRLKLIDPIKLDISRLNPALTKDLSFGDLYHNLKTVNVTSSLRVPARVLIDMNLGIKHNIGQILSILNVRFAPEIWLFDIEHDYAHASIKEIDGKVTIDESNHLSELYSNYGGSIGD